LSVQADERFERNGSDLRAAVHVPMTAAALGTTLAFETLDSHEDLAIAAGTQSGHVVRLRGKGVPHVRGRGRGDLLIRIVVDTPTGLDKEQEELLRRLAAERGEQVAPPGKGLRSHLRSALS
jgi:molecular chaperone DnaJ